MSPLMVHELDSRTTSDGDVVILRWNSETDAVELEVEPAAGGRRVVSVRRDRAADAFRHPYAYLPPEPR